MRDLLVIDGIKMDMSESDVYINYNSNILGDISKIESGFTYTIKLPKTANNMNVIKVVKSTSSTDFPYKVHTAMLLRDGIPIVRNANVELARVTSTDIELSLSFGAGAGVKRLLKDNERKLSELSCKADDVNDYVLWSKETPFSKAYYGFKDDDVNAWYHPCVSSAWVLDRIAEDYNIAVDYTSVADKLKGLHIPLLRRKGLKSASNRLTLSMCSQYITDDDKVAFNSTPQTLEFIPASVQDYGVSFERRLSTDELSLIHPKRMTTKFYLSGDIEYIHANINEFNVTPKLSIVQVRKVVNDGAVYYNIKKELASVSPYDVRLESNGAATKAKFNFSGLETEFTTPKKGGVDYVALCMTTPTGLSTPYVSGIVDFISENQVNTYEFGEANKDTDYPNNEGYFYYAPNLPDISIIDYIKGLCEIVCAYIAIEDNCIKLISRDDVVLKSQNIEECKIEDVSLDFSIDDIAQENICQYKGGSGLFSASFVVNDNRLEKSAVFIESPFNELKVGAGYNITFDLYSYNNNEQQFKENTEPYITNIIELGGDTWLTVDGLRWSQILKHNYNTYIKIVQNAKRKTSLYKLTPIDLHKLDLNKCVYDDGAYWIINTIKTKKNDIAEVELIKLN